MSSVILCAVDGSAEGRAAVAAAARLAPALGLALRLAHVGELPGPPPTTVPHGGPAPAGAGAPGRLAEAARRRAELIFDDPHLPGEAAGAGRTLLLGDPADALAEAAKEPDVALVATGTRGHGAVRSLAIGGVSLALAARSPAPVLVTPAGPPPVVPFGRVVCGVDASPEALDAARVAGRLSSALDDELVLVSAAHQSVEEGGVGAMVAPPPAPGGEQRALDALERARDETRVDARIRLTSGDAGERLLDVADRERAELVVVGSRRRGAFRAALLGSVSARVAARAHCPVVVVPAGAAGRFLSVGAR